MSKIITTKINEISDKHSKQGKHEWTRIDMHLEGPTLTIEYECDGISGCGAHMFEVSA